MSTNDKTYYYKLFRVKRKDGRVTTVSVDPVLVTKACQVIGSLREVGKIVREAAYEYEKTPEVSSCSRYVSRQLMEVVAGKIADIRDSRPILR